MVNLPFPTFNTANSGNSFAKYMPGLGAIGGGIAGLVNNPADAANKYTSQIPETITPYYDPYIQAGQRSLSTLEKQFQQLLNNPQLVMEMLGSGFQESPGYEYSVQQSTNAVNNAASAGGNLGGSAHQANAAATSQGLADQEYYDYLDRVTGLFNTGLSGLGDINQMGFQASDALAGMLAQALLSQARLSSMGAMGQNSSVGSILGGVTDIATSLF